MPVFCQLAMLHSKGSCSRIRCYLFAFLSFPLSGLVLSLSIFLQTIDVVGTPLVVHNNFGVESTQMGGSGILEWMRKPLFRKKVVSGCHGWLLRLKKNPIVTCFDHFFVPECHD